MWFVCVFFSLSDSKLIPYILPAMPALALLIAALPEGVLRRDLSRTAIVTVAIAIGLAAALPVRAGSHRAVGPERLFPGAARPLAEIALLLAVSGLYVLSRRRRDATGAAMFLGAGWCLAGLAGDARRLGGCADLFGGRHGPRVARRAARRSRLQRRDV